ncbi:hypothetical protein [Fibrobacter sp. UWB11]|uniref:hypothetical protein n=1 Tax=Fibrobacter sp. UWB11 TaxID=1896202 RepID=UPI00092BAC9C|nr:hypothetical protein [Fibrobacter sp. UWB11]SIO40547.1 hypothetical protein SAMN05720758_2718 [Fibrobacter sp. UWB11]
MFDLNAFFDGMSKPLLRNAHAKAFGKKGLLNNALIQSETLSFYSDKERVAGLFSKMEMWQRRCLNLIYNSGSRGLAFNELRLTVPVSKNRELQTFLLTMCREYVIYRSFVGGTPIYMGFGDFVGCFDIKPEGEIDTVSPLISFQNLLDWHICIVLANAKKKQLRINANGTLHRRGRQICAEAFTSSRHVSEKACEHEISLIFSFLVQNGWLERENSFLLPSATAIDFIHKNGFRLHQDVISWWIKERFHGDRNLCARLLSGLGEGLSAADAALLFWVMDPSYRIQEKNKVLPWEFMPRPLCELWILGLVDFRMAQGKITSVVLSKSGRDWLDTSIASIPEANLTALPNFDLVVSTGMAPRVLYSLACLAKVKNDETFLCFTLEKETYVAGLKCGFPESEVENLRNWLKPPENVSSTLAEWNASFYGAKVRTARLLKVESAEVLSELSRFPQFMECTEEYIPGYGFILNPELESRAFEILENYGFFPYAGESTENRTPAAQDEWKAEFSIAWPESKKIDYDLRDEADEASAQATMDSTKYGSVYQKLSTFDLVKVLRYAKTVGTPLAAKIMDKSKRNAKLEEKMFYVHALHLAKSPSMVEIQESGKEEKFSLDLSFIQEIKVLSKKATAPQA